MGKKWFGKVIYEGEGCETEHEFETEAEAKAFVRGFHDAKGITEQSDDDCLEEYYADYTNEAATIEN